MGNRKSVKENLTIKIEPLTGGDVKLLRQTAIDAYLDHFKYLWFDEGQWYIEKVYNQDVLKNELLDGNNQFFLAWNEEEPVGFLKIKLDQPLAAAPGKNALELEKIYLRHSARGLGIGKEFMELAFTKATELGKDIVWLKAMDSSLDSISFYKRNGFAQCGNYRLDFDMMIPKYRGMVILQKSITPF